MATRFEIKRIIVACSLLHLYAVCCSFLLMSPRPVHAVTTFGQSFYANQGTGNLNIENGGQGVQLILTRATGSGFASINQYLFGSLSMQIKLVPGNSAGTVTAYYLSSATNAHDEVDFEFLGNLPGQPYILQTNLFANGVGGREMRHHLWFDPTADFHTYSILWNHQQIVFFVDSKPIRVYSNNEAYGVPYPNKQPMALYSSLWDGDSWATQGGTVKIDWDAAPFIASYQNFEIDACEWQAPSPACAAPNANWWDQGDYLSLTAAQLTQLQWVENNYLLYNYCTDKIRYPQAPAECAHNP